MENKIPVKREFTDFIPNKIGAYRTVAGQEGRLNGWTVYHRAISKYRQPSIFKLWLGPQVEKKSCVFRLWGEDRTLGDYYFIHR